MTALIVIGCILLVLFLIGMLNLKLYISAENEKVTLHFGVLFFKKKLYPQELEQDTEVLMQDTEGEIEDEQEALSAVSETKKSSMQTAPQKKKEKNPASSAGKKAAPSGKREGKPDAQEKDWKETLFLVLDIIRSVVQPMKFLLRGIRFEKVRLKVVVGGEEPDETAVRFGHWNAAVYGGLAALRNFMRIKCDKLGIAVDFTAKETELEAFGILKVRVWVVLIAAVRMIYHILVNTFKRMRQDQTPPNAVGKQVRV